MQTTRALLACLALIPFSGLVHAESISSNEVVLGYVSAFTGPVAGPVKEITAGLNLYMDAINASGGVHGRKIRIEFADDKFDAKLSPQLARELIKDKHSIALMLTRGTPQIQAMLPVIAETGTPMIGPSSGASLLHEPMNPLVFNIRTKYRTEAERAIQQLASQGVQRIAAVHVDDSFGADAMVGYEIGFKKANLRPIGIFKFDRQATKHEDVAKQIVALNPDAVVTVGSAKAIANIVRELRTRGSVAQIITLSNNSAQSFIKDLGTAAHGVVVMQVFPDPAKKTTALAVEMSRMAAQKADFPLSHAAMEGYVTAKVIVEGLRRAGRNLSRQKFVAALESLEDYSLGSGLKITYGPSSRTGLDFVEPSIINKRGSFTQ